MANQKDLDFLHSSNFTTWNEMRLQNSEFMPDLSNADLSLRDLSHRNLSGANLSNANLRGAYLMGADLSNANLNDADFSPNEIISPPSCDSYGNLHGQVLTLKPSDLGFANFADANLVGANLTKVKLWKTIMPNGEIKSNY